MTTSRRLHGRRLSPLRIGTVFLVAAAIVVTVLAFKNPIASFFRSGETVSAEFERNYQLHEDETKVKVAGLEVGVITGVHDTDNGTVLVTMKVDESAVDTLGPKPSAVIAPKTILGGQYAVELQRGGGRGSFEGTHIPRERTQTPIELDRILEALPRGTRASTQHVVGEFGRTLERGGKDALRDLAADAAGTLEPAGDVLAAARGTRPGADLEEIVSNFHTVADVLTEQEGRLGEIVTSLRDTTAALGAQSRPVATAITAMPGTLRATRAGVRELRGTLDKLTTTARAFRPAARQLDPLLARLEPVLGKARPLMRDLRPLLRDARPMIQQLIPVTTNGTRVFDDLRGPVLDRVNGPITETIMTTWRGRGPYKDSGGGTQADHKFYQELGYLAANLDRASMWQDKQGSMVGFQIGAGTETLAGNDLRLYELLRGMPRQTGGGR